MSTLFRILLTNDSCCQVLAVEEVWEEKKAAFARKPRWEVLTGESDVLGDAKFDDETFGVEGKPFKHVEGFGRRYPRHKRLV